MEGQRRMHPSFDLIRPQHWCGGLILSSPHSGRDYPAGVVAAARLPEAQLRSSEDAFVDRLIASAPGAGAVILSARIPRAVVDLNRGRDDLDPLAVEGVQPSGAANARTLAGLGVIPRVVAHGRAIYDRPIPRAEAERRLDAWWQPYHDALSGLMAEAVARFGQAVLIDVHSMPREALTHLTPRPHAVLGDRHGRSAGGWLRLKLAEALEREGLTVRLNAPFAGAYIAQAYGNPGAGRHVVQLELDRSLYMDEARIVPHEGFDALSASLGRVFAAMQGPSEALAAE
ncbi:N-formylglutamate amidohydrolase [Paracoccus sp. S-4012]|uniref:N-formylglutamate amidohydrolase n=1 Tax=Paracoccus sp. S-4012 TaxID=2665648 RepID=UPI0012AEEE2E|nr:N-formylglutamate amidohydrolase [Paracoccus sp. S-4012]MRX49893.1 N-formylglutamate amidohydrolase [Paracoccus sp. S-4012]